jgi:hypothetical protein
MTRDELNQNLCSYDKRNPNSIHHFGGTGINDDAEPRRDGCGCDNCFYGRDGLAVELLSLMNISDGDTCPCGGDCSSLDPCI